MFNKEERRKKLEAKIMRGREAEQLLSHPYIKDAFETMEADVLNIMKRLKPDETEKMEIAWREMRAIERFKGKLTGYVTTGEIAQQELVTRMKDKLWK